ncbi:MAG: N-acetylneuraminate synthase family protein [Vicinamibacterales bacterium]
MSTSLEIGGRRIGDGAPLFVIAEIGLNHGGSLDRALALVDAAAQAGASAVKLQTLRADDLVAADCPPPAHVPVQSLRAFFAQFELDDAAHRAIVGRARASGLVVMATPFSLGAVDLLDDLGIDAFKIASGDVTYHGLIDACARTGKPVVVSTGMASIAEIDLATWCAYRAGTRDLALLHCVSAYPVPQGSENLRAIATLAESFSVPVGLSDHSAAAGASAVPVAIALGASLYERHLVLDDDDAAIDRAVSSTPGELAALVRLAADTAAALGHGRKECLPAEAMNQQPSRRALRAARSLTAGHVITRDDLVVLRPAAGLAPQFERDLIGVPLTRDNEAGAPFLERDLPALRGPRETYQAA